MMSRLYRTVLSTAAIVVLIVTAMIGVAARGWIDKSFPGFFVLGNRVIPSVGLPHWSASRDGGLYQRTPLCALFPRPEQGDPLTAVLVNSSGVVVGGDRLSVNVEAEDGGAIVTRPTITSRLTIRK